MMKDTKDGSTHYDGCWREREHWECAVAMVQYERERCERLLKAAKRVQLHAVLSGYKGTDEALFGLDALFVAIDSIERPATVPVVPEPH